MSKTVEVVAGVMIWESLMGYPDKVLLMRRPYQRVQEWSEVWCHAGGKIEEGETPEEALIREWQEELGQSINVISDVLHEKVETSSTGVTYRVRYYKVESVALNGPDSYPRMTKENIAIGWWTKQEALMLPLTPGDRETVLMTMG